MIEGFVLGLTAAVLIALVAAIVVLLRDRWRPPPPPAPMPPSMEPQVQRLMRFTSNFARDFSEYRALIAQAAAQAEHLRQSEQATDRDFSAALLAQIVEVNEFLQQRLVDAEKSLVAQAQQLDDYRTEARTDALTSLPNRRAFDEELSRRLGMHRRQGMGMAVLLLDVDRFKSVNDKYGHDVGDMVLKAVAQSLRSAVRDTDIVARYGGEEFVAALCGASTEEFNRAAERVREAVAKTPLKVKHEGHEIELPITVSCGFTLVRSDLEASQLLRLSDEALYRAKTSGRNCTYRHEGTAMVRVTPEAERKDAAESPRPDTRTESFRQVCDELRRKLQEIAK